MSEIGADAIRKLSEQIAAFGRQEQPSSVWGTVKSSGKDVTVLIDGGEVPTPIDECLVSVNVGDRVRVEVDGGKAVVTGNSTTPPTGDEEAVKAGKAAVEALDGQKRIEQHFWHDEQGAHVSESGSSTEGGNMLLRSNGTYIRDGEKNLMSVSYNPDGWNHGGDRACTEMMGITSDMLIKSAGDISVEHNPYEGSSAGLSYMFMSDSSAQLFAKDSAMADGASSEVVVLGGGDNSVTIKADDGNLGLGTINLLGNVNIAGTKLGDSEGLTVNGVKTNPSGISIAVGASPSSLTTTKSLVPLNVAGSSYGEGMYNSVGGCIGCSKSGIVRVSGQLYVSGGLKAGDRVYGYICRIDAKLNILSTNAYASTRAYGTYDTVILPPVLVHVDAGDYLALYANNSTGSRGNLSANTWSTYLTAEYVALD